MFTWRPLPAWRGRELEVPFPGLPTHLRVLQNGPRIIRSSATPRWNHTHQCCIGYTETSIRIQSPCHRTSHMGSRGCCSPMIPHVLSVRIQVWMHV